MFALSVLQTSGVVVSGEKYLSGPVLGRQRNYPHTLPREEDAEDWTEEEDAPDWPPPRIQRGDDSEQLVYAPGILYENLSNGHVATTSLSNLYPLDAGNYHGLNYLNGFVQPGAHSPSTILSFSDELQPSWITAETFYYDEDNNYRGSSNSNYLETGYPAVTTLTYHYPLSGSDELNMTRGQSSNNNNNSVSGDGSSSSSMPYLRYSSRAYQTPGSSYLNAISPPPIVTSSAMSAERPLSRSRSYGNAKYPVDYNHHHHHNEIPARTDSPKGSKDPASKKWSFGALFRKKSANSNLKSPVSSSSLTFIPPTDLPPHLVRNNMPKLGKAEGSSELSSSESEIKSSTAVENGAKRQNFLSRRLSKRKEKKSAQKNSLPSNSYLEVPRNGHSRTEPSNGSASSRQGWETTKKPSPVPQPNYSSSGSYTLSFDDLGRPIKTHRASVKDAVKARAVARRESFFNESSSSEDDNASSSLQGSHSSLSSRTRGRTGKRPSSQNQRPELVKPSSLPESHSFHSAHGNNNNAVQAPPSPRWEARVVYTEETIEQDEPVIIRLPSPRKSQQSPAPYQQQYSSNYTLEPGRESQAQILRAGLQVPLIVPNSNLSPYPADDRTYANLPTLLEDISAPPPPPRDFRQQYQTSSSNNRGQHFYRPVSCSYLDSYRNYQEQADYAPHFSPVQLSIDQRPVPYNVIPPRSSPSPLTYSSSSAVRTLPETGKSAFIRSPSEPPEMKTELAMIDSSRKRNAVTPGVDSPRQKATFQKASAPSPQQPVMSKLGYPVRKLTEAAKLPATQSPVHMQASEFWRKKEQEITGSASSPTTSYQVKQKPFLTRNRSADSSPVPGPKSILRTSPRNQLPQRQQQSQGQNSNDSISSLSSISAEAPSPSNLHHQQNGKASPKPQLTAVTRPQSLNFRTVSPIIDRSRSPFSACERLNVRLPSSMSANQHAKEAFAKQVTRPKSPTEQRPNKVTLVDKVPGGSEALANALAIKATGKNLEDALNELEDMYKSLRLSDEDLLDRAERRDLPTAHQELRNAPMPAFRFSPLGSVESLNSSGHVGTPGTGSSLGGGSSFYGSEGNVSATGNRIRAPPLRRSCRPDTVADDMAKRRFDHGELKPSDPRSIVSKAGCFMMKSPAFSPPSSPLPLELPNHLVSYTHDPDLTLDDVLFRNYKRANSIKIIDPQPPFGIPLGPLTPAPASDYLHSQPEEKYRPIFRNTKRPDIVKDDIAFRNLRKDLSAENNLNKDWTPRLFNKEHQMFTYNIHDNDRPASSKKLRAIRSLSANISHLIPFKESMVNNEIGKWNSFSDLYAHKLQTPNHKQPSWVEEIERLQQRASSSDTLPALQPPVLYPLDGPTQRAQEASAKKLSLKSESCSGSVSSSDSKARRPWTDVLLQSFEQEKEDMERLNAQAMQALQEHDKAESKSQSCSNLDSVFHDADAVGADIQSPVGSSSSRFSTPPETTFQSPATFSSPDPQPDDKPTPKKRSQVKGANNASDNASLFTPLPPPRKVHQIHLDSFSQSTEPPSPTKSKNSTEDELTTLIDALVRDADSCIPPNQKPQPPQPKSILKSTSTSAIEKSYASSKGLHQSQDENQNMSASPEGVFDNPRGSIDNFSEGNSNNPYSATASALIPQSSSNYPSLNTSLDNYPPDADSQPNSSSVSLKNSKASVAQSRKSENAIKSDEQGASDGSLGKSVFRIKMPWGNSSCSSPKPIRAVAKSTSKSTAESESEPTSDHPIKQGNQLGKDKSSRRKSNLNRALIEEPVKGSTAMSQGASQQDSPDTTQRVSSLDEMLSKVEEKLAQQSTIKPKPIDNKYVKPSTFSICKPRRDMMDDGDSSSDCSRIPVGASSGNTSSNAPGMTCIKRLLQKERFNCDENNCDKPRSNNVSPSCTGIKKSPSLGSNFSWPKFSGNSSPFFSKKTPEKGPTKLLTNKAQGNTPPPMDGSIPAGSAVPNTIGTTNTDSLAAAVEDKILALNVAQKANFFMKLEHEQRFSKWRHEARSERSTPVSYIRAGSKEKDTGLLPSDLRRVSQSIEITAKPALSITKPSQNLSSVPWRNTALSKLDADVAHLPPATTPSSLRNSVEDITFTGSRSFGSASKLATLHEEGKQTFPACYAPSSASVRHTPFGRDSSTKYLQSTGKFTPAMGRRSAFEEFYTPISWAPWENSGLQEGHYENNNSGPMPSFKRHGSTSDIEIKSHHSVCPQHGFKAWRKMPECSQPAVGTIPCPPKVKAKNRRVKSMIMSGTSDAENYSEDGEVSSGGQEVAEIISKSYENSPMIRKKHSKNQHPAPNLSKEIWRKCFHQPPESQRETNDIFYDASSEFECYTHGQMQVQAVTSPPSTSNLLHILNVLSSSNDDLDEKIPPRECHISPGSSLQHALNFADAVNLNDYDNTAQKPRTDTQSAAADNPLTDVQLSDTTSFSDVKREEDLLVIKKGVPLLRRKSSGKSRNPLKALAARMDFFN